MIATITGIDEPGLSMKGRLANLSAHGLSLILPDELPSGITVKVEWGNSQVQGRLVYCQPYGDEYRAGLQVEDPIYDATLARKDEKNPDPSFKIQGE
jgi:hypothetical protein